MSHNLQDILAAASGYQSVTSEPALNLKRPKTLDDYPVMPPASKNVSVISNDLTLHIGFDTEYVFNPETRQNDILSYQSYVVLPDNTGISNIIYPPDSQKKSRLSFKEFLFQTITPLLETGVITKWPGIINIYAFHSCGYHLLCQFLVRLQNSSERNTRYCQQLQKSLRY